VTFKREKRRGKVEEGTMDSGVRRSKRREVGWPAVGRENGVGRGLWRRVGKRSKVEDRWEVGRKVGNRARGEERESPSRVRGKKVEARKRGRKGSKEHRKGRGGFVQESKVRGLGKVKTV
jgi:hypothetical protein